LPIELQALSPFEKSVLREVRKIPFGKTASYKDIAKRTGKPLASRAVGRVLAKNPIPLVIACHRVIRSDGKPGGFSAAGGTPLKKKMLELEGIKIQASGVRSRKAPARHPRQNTSPL